jgi:dihydrofolate synthase/folylpolyglutamate synthase
MGNGSETEDVFSELFKRRTGAIKPGLARMREALQFLPELQNAAPCTLIAGTNGKGSTAGMLWHLLTTAGFKVGLYTSPHICHFRERIQISSGDIGDAELLVELAHLRAVLPQALFSELSFFEIATLLAALAFHKKNCDWIIYEVGLGGRWDSTNIFEPTSTAIVSIDYDHQAWLGNTLEQILGEKMGICRPGIPLFWGQDCTSLEKAPLDKLVSARAAEQGFPVYRVHQDFWTDGSGQVVVNLRPTPEIRLPIPSALSQRAPILQKNFAVALALFVDASQRLGSGAGLDKHCQDAVTKFGSREFPWPTSLIGRFQELNIIEESLGVSQRVIVDVCHNVDSVKQLLQSLEMMQSHPSGGKFPGIVSIAKDKDIPEILRLLRSVLDPLVLFRIHNDRAMSPVDLGAEHQGLALYEDFRQAWDYCWHEWRKPETARPWVVCGSFFTVGEVFTHFDVFSKTQEKQGVLQGSFRHRSNHPTAQ